MLDTIHTKLVNLLTAKQLYEVGMLDSENYIRTVNEILEAA